MGIQEGEFLDSEMQPLSNTADIEAAKDGNDSYDAGAEFFDSEKPEPQGEVESQSAFPNDGADASKTVEQSSDEEKWEPNYKIKVLDDEYEIDEDLRPVITKENYPKIKELYEKAYGLDHVKRRNQEITEKYNQQKQFVDYISDLKQNRDYNSLLKAFEISDDEVAKIALEKLRYQEMSPDQKAEYDANIQAKERLRQLENQNRQMQQQASNTAVQARLAELDRELMAGNHSTLMNEYDNRMGQQGAFRNEVISRGAMHYYQTGKDLPVRDVISMVVDSAKKLGLGQQQTRSYNNKPVIPRVNASSSTNPARKVVRSISDLRNIYNNLE